LKDDNVFIKHMLDEVNFITKEIKGLDYEDLVSNETLKRAIVRSLEIIGEAAKNLSKGFKDEHSNIKWRELAGLRDKLIHYYFGVKWERVWDVIKNVIPEIEDKLKKMLEE